MLRLASVEELEAILLRVPGLVELQDRRSDRFAEEAARWLKSAEEALAANRLPEAARIAALRSGLASVDQGEIPSDIKLRGQPTRTRVAGLAAARALREGTEILTGVAAREKPRLSEAESLAQQVIAAAASRGLVRERQEKESLTDYMRSLRGSLSSSSDIEAALVRIEGLVGQGDALVLLDRACPPAAFAPPA